MTREDVMNLMMGSKNSKEWNDNCDKVKAAFNGYPAFWFADIIASGIYHLVKMSWPERKVT